MRLEKLQSYIEEKGWKQEYTEEGGCGSLDFEHRGLSYHVWEFRRMATARRAMWKMWAG